MMVGNYATINLFGNQTTANRLNYLDDRSLLGIILLVNFLRINPSWVDLTPPKPLHTKFHENRWMCFLDSDYICMYIQELFI